MKHIAVGLLLLSILACSDTKPADTTTQQTPPSKPEPTKPVVTPPAGSAAAMKSAGSGTGSGSAAPAAAFKVGDLVHAMWTDGYFYPGKIAAVNANGTFRVHYNDGDVSPALPLKKLRPRKASTARGKPGSACSGGRTSCGGRCVDLLNDNKNCNACGRTCPEACMGGSCVSNAYKYGT